MAAESNVISFFPGQSRPTSLRRQTEQIIGRGAVSSRCNVRNMIVFLLSHASEESLERAQSSRRLAFGCFSNAFSAIWITCWAETPNASTREHNVVREVETSCVYSAASAPKRDETFKRAGAARRLVRQLR